jgi:hypothetical protein
VDREIRVIYAEYTLSATDLGHVNGELIRYRTSVIRAIESDTLKDFERIAASLPQKRARIEKAIERFIKASNTTSLGKGMNAEELREVREVKAKLAQYITSSHRTIDLLEKRWRTASAIEARRLRDEAERNAAGDAGEKFIAITLEMDQLLDAVAKMAGTVKEEADIHLRILSGIVVAVSLALAILALYVGKEPARAALPQVDDTLQQNRIH